MMLSTTPNYRRHPTSKQQQQVSGSAELTEQQKLDALASFEKHHGKLVVDFAQPYVATLDGFLRTVDKMKSVADDQKKVENWDFSSIPPKWTVVPIIIYAYIHASSPKSRSTIRNVFSDGCFGYDLEELKKAVVSSNSSDSHASENLLSARLVEFFDLAGQKRTHEAFEILRVLTLQCDVSFTKFIRCFQPPDFSKRDFYDIAFLKVFKKTNSFANQAIDYELGPVEFRRTGKTWSNLFNRTLVRIENYPADSTVCYASIMRTLLMLITNPTVVADCETKMFAILDIYKTKEDAFIKDPSTIRSSTHGKKPTHIRNPSNVLPRVISSRVRGPQLSKQY
jgi:hypothetical protein